MCQSNMGCALCLLPTLLVSIGAAAPVASAIDEPKAGKETTVIMMNPKDHDVLERALKISRILEVDQERLERALKITRALDLNQLEALASQKTGNLNNRNHERRLAAGKRDPRKLSMGGTDVVLDHLWLLVCGVFVMFMQAGFAMLEAGTCREKNVNHIMIKNLTDVCVGTVGWYLLGWSFAYGGDALTRKDGDMTGAFEECNMDENPMGCGDGYADNGFIGGKLMMAGSGFLGKGENATKDWAEGVIDPLKYGGGQAYMWFFQWAFCTAAATIVSGGVAERVRFPAYVIYSFLMSTVIYPVVVCSTWGYGWLETFKKTSDGQAVGGYIDFAGSGVVHLTGGVGALFGAIIVGRRTGRFDSTVDQSEFAPHSQPLCVLGTFILWMGWYGFNPGSTLGFSDNGTALKAAFVAMNTTLAAATGGLTVFTLRYISSKKYDLSGLCNGILAGLVSITAPCSNVETGSAFLIGIIGGFVYSGSSALLQKLKIDDPLDAFSVHGAAGIWGCMAAALFDFGAGTDKHHGWGGWSATSYEEGGETKYMTTGDAFAANMAEVLFIFAWSGGATTIIFGIMKALKVLRVDEEEESHGLDSECASPGYRMSKEAQVVSVAPSKDAQRGA